MAVKFNFKYGKLNLAAILKRMAAPKLLVFENK